MTGRLLVRPKTYPSTKHVVPTPPFPLRTTTGFTVDVYAHFSSITGPSTTVRTSRRIQGAVLHAVALHIFFRDAFDATEIRALHMSFRAVEAFVESSTTFGAHSDTAPHAGPRTHVLFVVLPFLKRHSQPTPQPTANGSPQTKLLHVCLQVLRSYFFTTPGQRTRDASPSTLRDFVPRELRDR